MEIPIVNNTPAIAIPTTFPARTRQATTMVASIRTDATALFFMDKILLTISQDGRLAHWIHVPLESSDPTLADRRVQFGDDDGSDLLPLPHLTATTILGGADADRDTLGQLFATQIASSITARMPKERRLLVVGLGLRLKEIDGDAFVQILDLAMDATT